MTDAVDPKEMQKALLTNLVLMLSSSAMQQMGKLRDPADKTQVNLEAAQVMIDMIDMLQAKMKGNLDPDEAALLTHTLSSLQMTYVDTAREQKTSADTPPPTAHEPAKPEHSGEVKGNAPGVGNDAKYHKSYG